MSLSAAKRRSCQCHGLARRVLISKTSARTLQTCFPRTAVVSQAHQSALTATTCPADSAMCCLKKATCNVKSASPFCPVLRIQMPQHSATRTPAGITAPGCLLSHRHHRHQQSSCQFPELLPSQLLQRSPQMPSGRQSALQAMVSIISPILMQQFVHHVLAMLSACRLPCTQMQA